MSFSDIMVYVATFGVAIGFFFFVRWAAAKFGGQNMALAQVAFANAPDFVPDHILLYLGSAIAYDETRNAIAIWEKARGVRVVDRSEVGGWHSGTLLTVVLSRTTATPMVQLYAPDTDRPFFKVGVLDARVCPEWATRLASAFGADKDREVAVRVLGVN